MGKREGRHPVHALTTLSMRKAAPGTRLSDGGGLFLVTDKKGSQRWILRTVIKGKGRHDIGLGSARLVGLAEAREKAAGYRKAARDGRDILAEKRKAEMIIPNLETVAYEVHRIRTAGSRCQKHKNEWINSLKNNVFQKLGSRPIDQIESRDILEVLKPIWHLHGESASRIQQRLQRIFSYAKKNGWRTGDNPAEDISDILGKPTRHRRHFLAMDYREIPKFIVALKEFKASASIKLAMLFCILCASRGGEVLGATWNEINFAERKWIVPEHRMKRFAEHVVPLSSAALAILDAAKEVASNGGPYIFPGQKKGKPFSGNAFPDLLERMDVHCNTHGFRAAFKSWAEETTGFKTSVIDFALAHKIKDPVERAYFRGTQYEQRVQLMETWGAYVTSAATENVIPFRVA